MEQDSLAVLALTNRMMDAGVPALKAGELWRVLEKVAEPSSLLGLDERSVAEATSGTGIEAARLVRLLDAGVGLAVRLDALQERGISALTLLDERYPARLRERLGTAAPPVLYCAGKLALLGIDGIGVVGSRDVGPEGVEVTRKVAPLVADAGLPLVSGGAKGVDQIGMAAAYESGGQVVGVLADSLERAIGRADNRRAMLEGRACLCTPYQPDARFTAGLAMGRNKIIYGLSRVTLVVASAKAEGGTWAGASEAIKKGYGRVAVWTGAGGGPGNDALVAAGASPVAQPEAVLDLDAVGVRIAKSASQMALALDLPPTKIEPSSEETVGDSRPFTSDDLAHETAADGDAGTTPGPGLVTLPPGALTPQPTGVCWCGCGKEVEAGAFFLPRHAPGAARRAVLKHFGSVEQFLVMLGEGPSVPND